MIVYSDWLYSILKEKFSLFNHEGTPKPQSERYTPQTMPTNNDVLIVIRDTGRGVV